MSINTCAQSVDESGLLVCYVKVGSLTHSDGEYDDAKHIHLFAAPRDHLVLDLRGRGYLQEHWVAHFGVIVVGHDVNVVGLGLLC